MTIDRRRYGAGFTPLIFCLSFTLFPLPSLSDTTNKIKNPPPDTQVDPLATAQHQIARLRQTANQLRLLATQPIPANVPNEEQEQLVQHGNWLREEIKRMTTLADHWEQRLPASGRPANETGTGQSNIANLNYFYELQTVGLQKRLQQENAKFSTTAETTQPYYATTRLVIGNMR
jgi:HAMP domain-containing protein